MQEVRRNGSGDQTQVRGSRGGGGIDGETAPPEAYAEDSVTGAFINAIDGIMSVSQAYDGKNGMEVVVNVSKTSGVEQKCATIRLTPAQARLLAVLARELSG